MATQTFKNEMNAVGTVETVINEVTATNRHGEVSQLLVGSAVYAGDNIKTGSKGLVVIELNNGSRFDLGRNSEALLDAEVLSLDQEQTRAEAVLEAQAIQDDLIAQLESGADPTLLFEATAAGGQPGAGGEISESADAPVVIDRTGVIGDVTAGYDTTPQSRGFPEVQSFVEGEEPEALLIPIVEPIPPYEPPVPFEPPVKPVIGLAEVSVSEEGLKQGNRDETGSPDTNNAGFVSGQLSVAADPDSVMQVWLSLDGLPQLSSNMHPVEWRYALDEGMENRAVIVGFADGREVLGISLNNGETSLAAGSATVDYRVDLLGQLDHVSADNEEGQLSFSVDMFIRDEAGQSASGSLTVYVEDDMPITMGDGNASSANSSLSINTLESSVSGELGILIGADINGSKVTLSYDHGETLTSNGSELFAHSDQVTGGIYWTTEGSEARVLDVQPVIDAESGAVSYTADLNGHIDQNIQSHEYPITVSITRSDTATVQGNFGQVRLDPGHYDPEKGEYIDGVINSYDDTGRVNGELGFRFYGYVDANTATALTVGAGNVLSGFDFNGESVVSVSGQNVGVLNNMITNDEHGQQDGAGQILAVKFDQSINALQIIFDQLDKGETAYYSYDKGEHWTAVEGSGHGGSPASDEKIDIQGAEFDEVWITGSEGSAFGILTGSMTAEWEETTVTEASYQVNVIDHTEQSQILDFNAIALDGDQDVSESVDFAITLDDEAEYDAIEVNGSTVHGLSFEQGDRLDLTDLLEGFGRTPAELVQDGVLQVAVEGNTAIVSVDLDAGGTNYQHTSLVTLTGLDEGVSAADVIDHIVVNVEDLVA
jgi:hypothetical protein